MKTRERIAMDLISAFVVAEAEVKTDTFHKTASEYDRGYANGLLAVKREMQRINESL